MPITLVKKQTRLYIVVKEYSDLLLYFCVLLSTLYRIIETDFYTSRHIIHLSFTARVYQIKIWKMWNNGEEQARRSRTIYKCAH